VRTWAVHRLVIVSIFLSMRLATLPTDPLFAQTAGVDVAVPRVAMVNITDSILMFMPGTVAVEQGDFVQWSNSSSLTHTTTSGLSCVGDGTWNQTLGLGVHFIRKFIDAPGTLPYFCIPHCASGMTGSVRLTTPIALQPSDDAGVLDLSWTGGGPTYQVFISASPSFVGSSPVQPAGGDTGTSFSDGTLVDVGGINYYLVMNK
jgi:plastocyanin